MDGLLPIGAFSRATLISAGAGPAAGRRPENPRRPGPGSDPTGAGRPASTAALAGFWAQALRRPVDPGANEHFATIGADKTGLTLMFLKVGEDKAVKNRCHLDLTADDRGAEVKRLLDLGAQYRSEHDEYGHRWIVLQDPSGNEFCVA
jgi:hypothetical protein